MSYGSATLTGTVNPNASDTSYYFQYGLTKGYGGQTAITDAGAGTHQVDRLYRLHQEVGNAHL